MQMHASYVKAVTKTKQALAQTNEEEANVAELRNKAVEYSRYAARLATLLRAYHQ